MFGGFGAYLATDTVSCIWLGYEASQHEFMASCKTGRHNEIRDQKHQQFSPTFVTICVKIVFFVKTFIHIEFVFFCGKSKLEFLFLRQIRGKSITVFWRFWASKWDNWGSKHLYQYTVGLNFGFLLHYFKVL